MDFGKLTDMVLNLLQSDRVELKYLSLGRKTLPAAKLQSDRVELKCVYSFQHLRPAQCFNRTGWN